MFKKIFLLCCICLSVLHAGFSKQKVFKEPVTDAKEKLPLIFHKNYDISLWGMQKLHPFDSCKYGKIYEHLLKVGISPTQFQAPESVTDQDLLLVHSQDYLDSLSYSQTLANIAEIPVLTYAPNFIIQKTLLKATRLATGGTVLGAQCALKDGWAINLSGGYHHAKHECGGGFCVYADIPLAITKVLQEHPDYKVMIVDLDAHQGNGHESYFIGDSRVTIYDIYNNDIYPQDHKARKRIDYNYPVKSGIADKEYLDLLSDTLPQALEKTKPNFIIYNAGSDIFQEDPLGRMNISEQGIIARDELVFKCAQERAIPILMVLSGGYTKKSAGIIGQSIENILKKIFKISYLK